MPESSKPAAMPVNKLLEKYFRWEEAFFAYAYAYVTLPAGWAFDDCLKPEFWVNVMRYFRADPNTGGHDKAGATIDVRTEDHAFRAILYVRAVTNAGLIVECLGPDVDVKTGKACLPHYFGRKDVETAGYNVRWNVGKRAFDIVRLADKEIVGDAKTRELAADWIAKTTGIARAA